MTNSINELALQHSPAYQQAIPILEILLGAKIADREVHSINYQMKVVKFSAYRNLYGFKFHESCVDERLIKGLHRCEFIEDCQNIVFVGGPGTGKTHQAKALAVQAIQHHHYRVRCLSTIELVNALEQEKQLGHAGRLQIHWLVLTWLSLMSWAICHSANLVAPCCFINSVNSMKNKRAHHHQFNVF